MLFRPALSELILAELGMLTIYYSGLEELLADFTSAILNPEDQKIAWEVISRMAFANKVDTLRRLFKIRCEQSNLDAVAEMERALQMVTKAGIARNDLVHGFAEINNDGVVAIRPGRSPRPITLEEVRSVNEMIAEADFEFSKVFTQFWNSTKGRFTTEPKTVEDRDKRVCPECEHVFKGNRFDGIDAHWRSKHNEVMPYEEAWPLIKSGSYGRR